MDPFDLVIQTDTRRHLLTHTSGFVYGALSPLLAQWGRSTGSNPGDDHTLDAISVPLVFSPGSSWMYGKSVDWAGRVVEGISGLSLEKYMKRNFFAPLGMDSTTFFMATRPDLQARRAEVDVHEVPGHPLSSTGPPRLEDPEIAVGGSGLFGSPSDYAKLLGALISGDSRILSPETFKIMITPQLEDTSIMQGMCETPIVSPMPDTTGPDYPHPVLMNHTLCGAVNMEGVPNHRKKGSVAWSGLTNGHWWIDPESGIAATVYVQVAPFGTPVAVNLRNELETEAYKLWGRK